MASELPFFDTSYLARIYLRDDGYAAVRELADFSQVMFRKRMTTYRGMGYRAEEPDVLGF